MPDIEPLVSLAVSMQANPGVYVVLLGSGISRSAGVPTGWEVVLELIKKLACAQGADCNPDPAAWYAETFGREPSYSDLIGRLELSPAARTQLLREYFEATETEREERKKTPTPAHQAVARLVAEGYIRIILTTNFDRLTEQALAEVGIHPVVVSTADAAAGMIPLAHARAVVVKLNGDYLDPRFRNTEAELAAYEPPFEALLDRLLDEFGLIVCGWSADWDTGLRAAVERCQTHRFTTYWAHMGPLGRRAHDLIALRRAAAIPITGADSFFTGLLEKVLALRDLRTAEPLSPALAVASVKRYLPEERHRIRLHDLLENETERALRVVFDRPRLNQITGTEVEQLRHRVRYYETATVVLRALLSAGCFFGENRHDALWSRALGRIATPPAIGSRVVEWADLELYPGLLIFYAAGIAAVAAENYPALISLLQTTMRTFRGDLVSVQEKLYSHNVIDEVRAQDLEGMEGRPTPLSNHLFEVLRNELQPYVPAGWSFENTFEWFEYLRALVYWDDAKSGWAPIGRFWWTLRGSELLKAVSHPDALGSRVPKILSAGLFGGQSVRYRAAKQQLEEWISKHNFSLSL